MNANQPKAPLDVGPPLRNLWALARPRLLPHVLALVAIGFAWAHWDRALVLRSSGRLTLVLASWALLHAGTLWLNAALDQDEGEVLYGQAVGVPAATSLAAYAALVACVPLSWWADPLAGVAAALCAMLAVLYSHPVTVWKGHPMGGPLVNIVGYGLLSPLAGWAVVDVSATPRTFLVWSLGALGIFGTFLAAQAFQADEDRARGYRTLVATRGPMVVLRSARLAIGLAMVGGMTLAAVGWLPRLCLFGIPGWLLVDRHLAHWSRAPSGGTEAMARTFTSRMLIAVVIGIACAFLQYSVDSAAYRPVAGLGTVRGHPPPDGPDSP